MQVQGRRIDVSFGDINVDLSVDMVRAATVRIIWIF